MYIRYYIRTSSCTQINMDEDGLLRTTQINQKVISYSDQIDTFVGTFDVFDLEDSPLINILAERFWIVF
jgi:hypothetical protein